jgi:hypothetical protein
VGVAAGQVAADDEREEHAEDGEEDPEHGQILVLRSRMNT